MKLTSVPKILALVLAATVALPALSADATRPQNQQARHTGTKPQAPATQAPSPQAPQRGHGSKSTPVSFHKRPTQFHQNVNNDKSNTSTNRSANSAWTTSTTLYSSANSVSSDSIGSKIFPQSQIADRKQKVQETEKSNRESLDIIRTREAKQNSLKYPPTKE